MVAVGRDLLGPIGAFAIVFGGLLATMSSANASILSTSRAIYAVSKDALLPRWASRSNLEYGTPHVALGLAGGPILVLTATGQVEILAEVASFLHLLMYGLTCVALVALRRDEPEWYDPDFRVPGYPVVPIFGALASFALVGVMNRASQLIGLAILLAMAGWYFYYARDVTLKGPCDDTRTRSGGLIDLLGTVDVTVLGYHVIPEQTPPDQARAQFEDRASGALEDRDGSEGGDR